MKRRDQIVGVVILIIAALLLWQSTLLRYYTSLGPGPGFFGFWLAMIQIGLAVSIIITATLSKPVALPADFWPVPTGYFRIGTVLAGFVWMALTMEVLGYRIASLVFLLALMFVMGARNILLVIACALLGSFGIYHLFVEILLTRLPRGVFGI